MNKNEFLPFGTAANANVLPNADYQAMPARTAGFGSGVAKSEEMNSVWRQSSVMASAIGKFIAEKANRDVLDNGDIDALQNGLEAALSEQAINIASLLSSPVVGALTASGYCIIPTKDPAGAYKNIIIQMGTGTIPATSGTISYPIAFPKRVIALIATKYADGNRYVTVVNDSVSSFQAYGWISGGAGNADNFGWIAIGE
ncbi:gp53-like domain-containing protein [Serratia liquefaciens]|uniref:gp53-like domain-containing protein n=1 Tax=Serratia liquefaciens TaxID=614 RepID=UPI003AF3717E